MEPGLIDAYVHELRGKLRWHPDADNLADEVADHLREHAERLTAQGHPVEEAQRRALARFGHLGEVARSFAENDSGSLAVPSRFTRLAGAGGIAAGAVWAASTVAAVTGGHMDVFVPWSLQRYQIWVGLLMVALTLTTLTLAGVLLRTGRLRTPHGLAVVTVGLLLVVAMSAFGWAVTLIAGALSLPVMAAFRVSAPGAARFVRPARVLVVWLLGGVALVVFDEVLPVGPADDYGDHQLAWLVPFVVCALCSAAAIALVGVRLWAERPADLDDVHQNPVSPLAA
jgi:hypothetical protein